MMDSFRDRLFYGTVLALAVFLWCWALWQFFTWRFG